MVVALSSSENDEDGLGPTTGQSLDPLNRPTLVAAAIAADIEDHHRITAVAAAGLDKRAELIGIAVTKRTHPDDRNPADAILPKDVRGEVLKGGPFQRDLHLTLAIFTHRGQIQGARLA